MGVGPAFAIPKVLEKTGLSKDVRLLSRRSIIGPSYTFSLIMVVFCRR